MEVIYKYPIETTDHQTLQIPKGAQLLTIQMQGGRPCIWAKVNPENEMGTVRVTIKGTGHAIAINIGEYLGTYQEAGGALVWHVFIEEVADEVND